MTHILHTGSRRDKRVHRAPGGALDDTVDDATEAPGGRAAAAELPTARAVRVDELRGLEVEGGERRRAPAMAAALQQPPRVSTSRRRSRRPRRHRRWSARWS